MGDTIHVLILDDHALVRSGLKHIVEYEPDMVIVGEASLGSEAINLAVSLQPEVVLIDLSLPDISGVEVARTISSLCPQIKLIALTMYSEENYLEAFINAGGHGYLTKSAADRELIASIRQVMMGCYALQPEGVRILAQRVQQDDSSKTKKELSEREKEVLILTVKGYTSKEIGEKLCISARTVETYRHRIMVKLDLSYRSELVDYALRVNLI